MIKKLIGENIALAPVRVEDAEKWAEWLNDLAVSIPLGSEAYTSLSIENMRQEINEMIGHHDPCFTIVENESDRPIGRCLLFSVDRTNRTAMMGIFIGEKQYWNAGYGKEATRLLLDYAFNLLNLNSIMLGVFEFNQRAIHCYQSVGFKEIGRRRQARIIGGRTYDAILMDILAGEFHGSLIDQYLDQ